MTLPTLADGTLVAPGTVLTYTPHPKHNVNGDETLPQYRFLGVLNEYVSKKPELDIAVFGDLVGTINHDQHFNPKVYSAFPEARLVTWRRAMPDLFRAVDADDNQAITE